MNVIDFFCGCGGTSLGFQQAGMTVSVGIDFDTLACQTFGRNFPKAHVLAADIRQLQSSTLRPLLPPRPWLFSGCAPCQPFSKQNGAKTVRDSRRELLDYFGEMVRTFSPDYVFVENVPGLQHVGSRGPLARFRRLIVDAGYQFVVGVVPALLFGVPQRRERLVLLASLRGPMSLPKPTHGPNLKAYSTVREWIGAMSAIRAGQTDAVDAIHQSASLSELNLQRIRATPEGGGRASWPRRLVLPCHRGHGGHTDVYGRLAWDKPAAGLTTRCISYSNGRFGHPDQDRALSAREAACLQTFPPSYRFVGPISSIATQVGNAVPPLMARRFGEHLLRHLKKSNRSK